VAAAIPEAVVISVNDATRVSGLMQRPADAKWCFVLAHGAGAGMNHPFMAAVADELAALGVATLRYQFPFAEKKGRRPDPPQLAQATVRAAVGAAHTRAPDLPLIAGGKSFGGRMTSQAQAAEPLAEVQALAFLGFPLHPPGQPSVARAEHLSQVHVPMLFLQGTRDTFAELALIEPLAKRLGGQATLTLFEDADHSFHVPARTGRSDSQVRTTLLAALSSWADAVLQND
jgi:uncharacterized protein